MPKTSYGEWRELSRQLTDNRPKGLWICEYPNWNSPLFLQAGQIGCFTLMSHGEELIDYRGCCFMVYCSQITDLLIVLSIYSNLFSPCFLGKEQRGQAGENFTSSKLFSHIKTDRLLKFKSTFQNSNLVKAKTEIYTKEMTHINWPWSPVACQL